MCCRLKHRRGTKRKRADFVPGEPGQRRPDDEKMTEYLGLTAQLGVMYAVCAHQGRSHRCLSTNPAVSWQAWINWASMQGTSPRGGGPPRGRRVHRARVQGSAAGSFTNVSWGVADVHTLQQWLETGTRDGLWMKTSGAHCRDTFEDQTSSRMWERLI